MIPTSKTFNKVLACGKGGRPTRSIIKKSREKALARHDTVMRLLIRRYVTAEQRKRDDFGITEDDVMEIRQDISTLRYELIDILRQNGMRTPDVDKQDAALSGKKGRVMERRLQKDFQIGIVEGIVNAVITNEKEPKDVFSQIARAIGKRSSGTSKKDWNAVVRQNTVARDPIGSTNEAFIRQSKRSLRRHLSNFPDSDLASMDPDRLLEYNPNLSVVSPTTRIAYAKFIMSRIKHDEVEAKPGGSNSAEASRRSSTKVRNDPIQRQQTATPSLAGSLSESIRKGLIKSISQDKDQAGPSLEPKPTEHRSPTPIPEDPSEEDAARIKPGASVDEKNKREAEEETKPKEEGEKGGKKDTSVEEKERDSAVKKKETDNETKGKKPASTKKPPPPANQEPETGPVATTKLRGKSKATGQMMGGWI